MSFLGFSRGRSKKGSSKGGDLGFDLLFELSYLSAVAAAGVPRSRMFELASRLPCAASGYFREVDSLARNMNYQYAEACRLVGETAEQKEVQSLLFRFSSALASGESEAEFMAQEANIQADIYGNVYEGELESLRKWTDSFTALIVSAVLIIVVAAISTVIYDMGVGFVTGLIGTMVALSALGAWVIYRSAPKEVKTLPAPAGHRSQRVPRFLALLLGPTALVSGALLYLAGISPGWTLVIMAGLLLPIGVAAIRYDRSVSRLDGDISSLIRVLGATASAIGTTPVEAMGRIDLRSMTALAPAVKRLHTRLRSRASPELCWGRFVAETGSELISRATRVFRDGVSLGGDAAEIGTRAAMLSMKVNFLRAKRRLISSGFGWLCLVMHATVIFLLTFVIEIVSSFGKMIQSAGVIVKGSESASMSGLLSFNFQNMQFLHTLMIPVILLLSFINAIAPKVADDGYSHKFFFYLSVTLFTSGVNLVIVPKLADTIFHLAPTA